MYTFRFDTNGDAKEDIVFKVSLWGRPRHVEYRRTPPYSNLSGSKRQKGEAIQKRCGETLLVEGETGSVATSSWVFGRS